MEDLIKKYVDSNFKHTFDILIEVDMLNGKPTLLGIKNNTGYYINLFIERKEVQNGDKKEKIKFIDRHETLEKIQLPCDKEIIKDNFAMTTKYSFDETDVFISQKESKINFEEYLKSNDNNIADTNRKFINKILGFRSNTTWKKVTAVLIYIFLIIMIVNVFNSFLKFNEESNEEEINARQKYEKQEKDKERKTKENEIKNKKEREKIKKEEEKKMKEKTKEFDDVMKRKMDSNSNIGQYVNSYKIEDIDSSLPIVKIIIDNSVKYNEDYQKQEMADSIGHEVQSASRSTFTDDNPFIRIDYQNNQVFAESKTLSVNEFKVKN